MSLVELGEAALLKGQFEKAQWAFDSELYLHCSSSCHGDPSLWQRGLSCYYSGRFREGAEQFQTDLAQNGCDVEEVIWNFLCRCGVDGFGRAVADGFLPLRDDHPPVTPMRQVLDMYRGAGSIEGVLAAATNPDGSVVPSYNDTNALAYAHFYIGIYHEVRREFSRARPHLEVAAGVKNPDYMGQLMVMHYRLFCYRYPSETPVMPSTPPGTPPDNPEARSCYPAVQAQLIQGGWQLSKGHSIHCSQGNPVASTVGDLLRVFDAGIRSFDCGDIYTGVEELYGRLIRAHLSRGGREADIAVHTKLVPDLDAIQSSSVDEEYIESVLRRSLNRLGVECLSLVQLHWWDTSVPGYLEALRVLKDFVRKGLIKNIGITNFDAEITRSLVDAGIQIASTQVQYSLLDRRPLSSGLVDLCEEQHIDILAYGVLAGGFLTDAWLGKEEPNREVLANRSLVKYLLIIKEFGGWQLFQRLLHVLHSIADRHGRVVGLDGALLDVSIAMVAISYILGQRQVKSVIIGAHSDRYLQLTVAALAVKLTPADLAELDAVLALSEGPSGPVYGLERAKDGPHASIMKYNLNRVNQGTHLEELCYRYLQLHFEGHPTQATRSGYRFPLPNSLRSQLLETIGGCKEELDFSRTAVAVLRGCSYDNSLGPSSESEIQGYCSKVQQLLKEAEGLDQGCLSPDQLVDLKIIVSQLKLEFVQWRTIEAHKKDPAHYLPLNAILYLLPTWGPEGNGGPTTLHHPGVASMALCEKLPAILSRLRAIPTVLLQAHRNLTLPSEIFVKTALDICCPFSSFLANDLPLLCNTLVSEDKSGADFGPMLTEIRSASATAAQCVKKYASFLSSDLLPKSSASLGVGKEAYDVILKYSHFIDSSEELLALGEKHFARVKAELEALAAEINPSRTWQEITTNTIHPMHPSASNLLSTYLAEIERSRGHMISHELVSALPEDEKVVGFSTPKFLIPFSPFGDYLNPSPFVRMGCSDGDKIPRTGHLMLHSIEDQKLPEPEEQLLLRGHDYTWISVVSPHESYPGHHVQALLAQDHPRVLRKYYESILFYEGWGKYTEELAWETGFFERELAYQPEGSSETVVVPAPAYAKLTRLTQLRLQLWRAARVILDVKLNTGELSFEGCREFLRDEVMFNPGASKGEVFMYASRPGYAPCYLAGFVMIMELRQGMRNRMEKEGQHFQLKQFHDTLLSKGCVPFKLLRTLLYQ